MVVDFYGPFGPCGTDFASSFYAASSSSARRTSVRLAPAFPFTLCPAIVPWLGHFEVRVIMVPRVRSKVVVITGASAGIGRAAVRRFADARCDVGLIARGRDGLEAAAAEVEQRGSRPLILSCDVADADAVEHAAQQTEDQLGPIDIWVNNAMVSVFSPIREMTAAEFRRVTEVTYLGYVHGTLAALRRMLPRDRDGWIRPARS